MEMNRRPINTRKRQLLWPVKNEETLSVEQRNTKPTLPVQKYHHQHVSLPCILRRNVFLLSLTVLSMISLILSSLLSSWYTRKIILQNWGWTTYYDENATLITKCIVNNNNHSREETNGKTDIMTSNNETFSGGKRMITNPHLAVVIPFVPREVHQLIKIMMTWDQSNSRPCTVAKQQKQQQRKPELVFYISQSFNRDEASLEARRLLEKSIQAVEHIGMFFDEVHFVNANLTNEEDGYSTRGTGLTHSGPNIMFYNMVNIFHQGHKFSHVAYIEADATYVRDDWLVALQSACHHYKDKWMVGFGGKSLQATPPGRKLIMTHQSKSSKNEDFTTKSSRSTSSNIALQPWPQRWEQLVVLQQESKWKKLPMFLPARFKNPYCDTSESLNGNAIYAVHDECFLEFVRRLRYTHENPNFQEFHMSYDHNLFLYRCHPLHELKELRGKFVNSKLMLNARHKPWDRTYIQLKEPNVYIVTQAGNEITVKK